MTSGSLSHNGDDAVGLFSGTTMIDIVGPMGDSSNWGENKTLVRKAAAIVPSTTYSAGDWDSYASDTTTYLGTHTISSGVTKVYVTGYQNKDIGNVLTHSVTGLTLGTTYYYVVRAYNAYGTSGDSNEIEVSTLTAPLITVSGSMNIFSSVTGTASVSQSYKVSGSNLLGDITLNAPEDFELSKTSEGTYSGSLIYSPTGGIVAEQDVFVRIAASALAGEVSGNITHTSTDATQVDKAVSGFVYKAEPSNHVTIFAAGTATGSTVPLSWTDAAKVTPDGYLIKGSDVDYSSIIYPADGTAEANDLLVQSVTQGTQSYVFTGLNPSTTYYFKIYPYTNSGTHIDYKTDASVPQTSVTTQAVTVLAPGDLAIIAFQVDTPDQFAFLTFVPIDAGTEIKFTDNGWTDAGALATSEGTITWTAPASKFAAGQIVTITAGTPWTADKGTVSTAGSPAFATSGDQLIAYQGSSDNPTLLYALSTMPWVTSAAISSNTTYLPTGLVDGTTAVAFSTEYDDQYYNVTPISGTPAQILASIADEGNWVQSNDLLALPEWEVGTLPVELSSFTAIINSQNLVNIQWISQSESNLNGYYIQRSSSDQLSEAVQVSPLIHATNTSQQQVYVYTDSELQESGTYYYWLEVREMDGTMTFHGPRMVVYNAGGNPGTPNIPLITELKTIYPNPFNPSATIQYALAKEATVKLTIYNARGQIVRSFAEGDKASGTYNVIWNGMDNFGRECGTGIYYIRMQAGAESFIQKAVLMK